MWGDLTKTTWALGFASCWRMKIGEKWSGGSFCLGEEFSPSKQHEEWIMTFVGTTWLFYHFSFFLKLIHMVQFESCKKGLTNGSHKIIPNFVLGHRNAQHITNIDFFFIYFSLSFFQALLVSLCPQIYCLPIISYEKKSLNYYDYTLLTIFSCKVCVFESC